MKIYDHTVTHCDFDNRPANEALQDICNGFVWSECETTEQQIKFKRFVLSCNGIDVYYDYGADYYFFTDAL